MPTGTSGGWNKPKQPQRGSAASALGSRPKHPLLKGLIAGAAVVLVLGAVYFFMLDSKPKVEIKESTKPHRIKEVTPAPARTNAAPTNIEPKKLTREERNKRNIEILTQRYGTNMPPAIKSYIYYLKNPPKVSMSATSPTDFFTHTCERQIAAIMTVEPGAEFIIQPEYDERFDQDFINSMLDKIEIKPDDTEQVKELKQQMIETKAEITRICKEEGRKPSEVMNDHAKAMFDLGRYQTILMDQLREIRENPSMTDDDVKDAFAAANKMLEQKGLAPLYIPKLTRRTLQLQRSLERKAAAAADAAAKAAEKAAEAEKSE